MRQRQDGQVAVEQVEPEAGNARHGLVVVAFLAEGLRQVTHDHSLVAYLAESGIIEPDDIYIHPQRNQIYRSLGNSASAKVDTFTVPLKVGDLLLLCSDGLWEMVRDADIERIVEAALPVSSQICDMLVEAALAGGGKDNISVIAVCVRNDTY